MRILVPGLVGLFALIATWPVLCQSGSDIDGAETCRSLVVWLPWGGASDTWGFIASLASAVVAFVATRWMMVRFDARRHR